MSVTKPLRILVDLTRMRDDGAGGGIKTALLEMFAWCSGAKARPVEFVYVIPQVVAVELGRFVRDTDRVVQPETLGAAAAARLDCDLVYCPFGRTDWACPGVPTVTLVVDILHRDFPETLPIGEQRFREAFFQTAVDRTDLFQVISDFVGHRLHECFPAATDHIIRTYLPIHGRLVAAIESQSGERPYFFYPANAWMHKNHETLLVAYAIYRHAAGPKAWRLVLTGDMGDRLDRLRNIAHSLEIASDVEFREYIDNEALADCWHSAGALVFPSLHEGFGIPLLEAMVCNVPIIASDATATPEVVRDAALLVQARSPMALATGMERVAGDAVLRATLAFSGRRRLADFSQDREFGAMLEEFAATAARRPRWRRSGYHAGDGLTDPVSVFALPASRVSRSLFIRTRPLGVARTIEVDCGSHRVATLRIAPDQPTEAKVALPHDGRVLILSVPDASRLHPVDTRTHGVLLETLSATSDMVTIDLLAQ